jgi:hypothetical protein
VLEGEAEEVQARRGGHHAPAVVGVATLVEDGQRDPAEVEAEAGRPHHDRHVQALAVGEEGAAGGGADDPGHPLDSGGGDGLAAYPRNTQRR